MKQLKPMTAAELRRVEFVGPSVGEELLTHGLTALSLVIIGIMMYLSLRFEWRFAVAAIIANLHDVVSFWLLCVVPVGVDLPVLAGVLAVLGYSVNESVVVFDRVRENPQDAQGHCGDDQQRNYQHHEPHDHYPFEYANDGNVDVVFGARRCRPICAGADHRYLFWHLFVGAGIVPIGHVAGGQARSLHQGDQEKEGRGVNAGRLFTSLPPEGFVLFTGKPWNCSNFSSTSSCISIAI